MSPDDNYQCELKITFMKDGKELDMYSDTHKWNYLNYPQVLSMQEVILACYEGLRQLGVQGYENAVNAKPKK
jgi:hypothetical protein